MYRVLKAFKDTVTKEEYGVNQEIELTPARAIEVAGKLGKGYIEHIEIGSSEEVTIYGSETETIVFPNHVGGGNYLLSNGGKVKGKEAAIKAESTLTEEV